MIIFITVECITARSVDFSRFASWLQEHERDVAFCRGQGFDGASNTSSSCIGIQAKICQISPLALWQLQKKWCRTTTYVVLSSQGLELHRHSEPACLYLFTWRPCRNIDSTSGVVLAPEVQPVPPQTCAVNGT